MGGRPGLKRRDFRQKCLWPIENYMFLSDETEKNKIVLTLLSGEISSNCLSITATNLLLFLEEITGTYYGTIRIIEIKCKMIRVFNYYSRWKLTCRNTHTLPLKINICECSKRVIGFL